MKSIFITGVSGFVGTNLVNHYQQYDVRLYGNSRNSNATLSKQLKLLPDYSSARLDENGIDTFIHLAGIAHDLSHQYKPVDYYQVNFEVTKKAVDEFLKSEASKFIFVSSIKAAFDTSVIPAEETMKPSPQTDYGKSKLMAEQYIQALINKGNKKFYILRPAMIHGPGNKGNLNLLYRFAKSGWPFPFGALHNQRSFLSIDNFTYVVDAIVDRNISPGIYHLADEGFLSTVELYSLICVTMKSKPRILNVPQKLIETMATLAGRKNMIAKLTESMMVSNKKIVSELGSPLPTSLREGLANTIRSFDGK